MHLSVKGKQLDVGDALRSHVAETLNGVVGKYFGRPIEANVVFSREAHLFRADISVHVGRGILVQTIGEADEPYPAFDTACDKIAKRLRRYKSRLKDHHSASESTSEPVAAKKYILQAEDHGADGHDGEVVESHQPVVIAEMTAVRYPGNGFTSEATPSSQITGNVAEPSCFHNATCPASLIDG